MNIAEIKSPDLREYIKQCEKSLLTGQPEVFRYPESLIGKDISDKIWVENINDIKELNRDFLNSLKGNANIYAIYIGKNEEWFLKYVGQRKAKNMRERITQHLITKSKKTGSKLEYIRESVSKGYSIGLRLIKTDKDSLRVFIEEEIISRNRLKLAWNVHG